MDVPFPNEQKDQFLIQLLSMEIRSLVSCFYVGYGMGNPYSTLVNVVHRRYSTSEKTLSQLQIKCFPQTSHNLHDEKNRDRHKCEEELGLKKMNQTWNDIKCGFRLFRINKMFFSFFDKLDVDKIGLPLVQQHMSSTRMLLNNFQLYNRELFGQKLLPDPLQAPYIQPNYTLVLEIKDVLMHPKWVYGSGWCFIKRPGVDLFLAECAKYFEIVVYSEEQGITVFPWLDTLDLRGCIMYRLVRRLTHSIGVHNVNHIDNLNRDLKRVVLIDWDKNSTKLHPSNIFWIPRWSGNEDDTSLYDVLPLLTLVGANEVGDVREVLKYYNQFKDPIAQFKKKLPNA